MLRCVSWTMIWSHNVRVCLSWSHNGVDWSHNVVEVIDAICELDDELES